MNDMDNHKEEDVLIFDTGGGINRPIIKTACHEFEHNNKSKIIPWISR